MGDFDNDGRLDILITALDSPPALLRNEGAPGSWLTVVCEIPGGTADPDRDAGDGDRGRTDDDAGHRGRGLLPEHPRPAAALRPGRRRRRADEVVVRWPDGTRSVRKNVRARQFLVVKKGS